MTALTRRQVDLLRRLRAAEEVGPAFLPHAARGRFVLVGREAAEQSLVALSAFSGDTVFSLLRAGLITREDQETRIEYRGRRHLDRPEGRQVYLTSTGHTHLAATKGTRS